MRKKLILWCLMLMSITLFSQENDCEIFLSEYETWVAETSASLAKDADRSLSSKEIAELKMDFEQWEVNIEVFKKNGCATGSNNERLLQATVKARKALGVSEKK